MPLNRELSALCNVHQGKSHAKQQLTASLLTAATGPSRSSVIRMHVAIGFASTSTSAAVKVQFDTTRPAHMAEGDDTMFAGLAAGASFLYMCGENMYMQKLHCSPVSRAGPGRMEPTLKR